MIETLAIVCGAFLGTFVFLTIAFLCSDIRELIRRSKANRMKKKKDKD